MIFTGNARCIKHIFFQLLKRYGWWWQCSKENNPPQRDKAASPDVQHLQQRKRESPRWWKLQQIPPVTKPIKGTATEPPNEREVFAKDGACSNRPSKLSSQDRAKFATQQAIYQVSEPNPKFATQPTYSGEMNSLGGEMFHHQLMQSIHDIDWWRPRMN